MARDSTKRCLEFDSIVGLQGFRLFRTVSLGLSGIEETTDFNSFPHGSRHWPDPV